MKITTKSGSTYLFSEDRKHVKRICDPENGSPLRRDDEVLSVLDIPFDPIVGFCMVMRLEPLDEEGSHHTSRRTNVVTDIDHEVHLAVVS